MVSSMTITSMKTSGDNCSPCCESNEYGYGLRINLTEDQVEALGLNANPPKAGAKVGIRGLAFVCSVEQRVDGDEGDVDVCLSIQITDLEVTPAGGSSTNETAATMLYGEGEG